MSPSIKRRTSMIATKLLLLACAHFASLYAKPSPFLSPRPSGINRIATGLTVSFLYANVFSGLIPAVSSAMEWTDRNRLAAETWRTVDDIYLDRTFNGQDWFKLRQDAVKRSYSSDEEVYKSLQTMLNKLGDKYTRYLTPAQVVYN